MYIAQRRGRSNYNASPSHGRRGASSKPRRGENIDPRRFIRPAKMAVEDTYQSINRFDDFAMHPTLLANVTAKGFTSPSKVQDLAIPPGLEGRDVIGIANTGTGKTTAFALPILHAIMENSNRRALILAPTRELASQIEQEMGSFARGTRLTAALLIGGMSMRHQINELRVKPRVIIGTPGRIKDHIEQRTLSLSDVDIVVLDEVDRMVDMGFINDIRHLLSLVASPRQSLFFSATMDKNVEALAQTFMNDPVIISARTSDTSDSVEQNVVLHHEDDKIDKLHDILISAGVDKAIVFDETQRRVEKLGKQLADRGFKVDSLHGGKSQSQRTRALNRFRSNDVNILVATDVAARGIDVVDITHVINYAIPQSYDDYVHRIGRAGRAGRAGNALTFVHQADARHLPNQA